ncbi:MAG: hypothetical protein ACR2PR_09455, partial [Pseudohongiellaceae bacterium]
MPWAVAAAAVSAGGAISASNKQKKAAEGAADDASRAAELASKEYQAGLDSAKARLQPYADQSAIARNQMMVQMGLLGPGGGGGGAPGGGGGGYQMGGAGVIPLGDPSNQWTLPPEQARELDLFTEQLLQRNITASFASGYHRTKGVVQGARRTRDHLMKLQDEGRIPRNIKLPDEDQMRQIAGDFVRKEGGQKALIRKQRDTDEGLLSYEGRRNRAAFGDAEVGALADQFGITQGFGGPGGVGQGQYGDQQGQIVGMNPDGTPQFGVQAGGPGGMPDDQRQFMGGGGAPGGIQTIQTIQDRAGVTGPGEGFQERYYADLEAPTPQFGMGYQDNPAYRAMQDETARNVNQYAANAGSLYSGRRGEALREASANTQMQFYQDLANREQRAHEMGLNR